MPFEIFFSARLKVKVIGGQIKAKWSYIELVRAIICTFMHGFQKLLHSCFP